MPRKILQKYGYMIGTAGNSDSCLAIGCYEVGYDVPRVEMLDALMENLEKVYPLFHREYLKGIGTYEWKDGFNPHWTYEKHGYSRMEKLVDNTIVMSKKLCKQYNPQQMRRGTAAKNAGYSVSQQIHNI